MANQDKLEEIIAEVIAPAATTIDQTGAFPRAAVDALANAGLLALTVPRDHGGGGQELAAAADLVRRLGRVCGSTAMVVMMHYTAVAALAAGAGTTRCAEVAAGRHLTTLAFSEVGSRSHFWAPLGTAARRRRQVRAGRRKSWVTSAGEADSYVWSSRPLAAERADDAVARAGATRRACRSRGDFDGLGLRGNGSRPMTADGVRSRDGACSARTAAVSTLRHVGGAAHVPAC